MKVPTTLRYGLRILVEMGKSYAQTPLPLKTIAQNQNLPVKYAEKIINLLLNAGLLISIRGKDGGYLLRLKPEKIKLIDVFEALTGKLYLVECVINPKICKRAAKCEARRLWQLLVKNWSYLLTKITLRDLIAGGKNGIPREFGG
jgi:Rrf2 family protein